MNDSLVAVFLDRDGTIIEDTHYPRDPNEVALIPGATEGMRLMSEKGYQIFVISNQSGVGRGIIKDEEFLAVHARCCELLRAEAVEVCEFAYCFHKPEDNCSCRKPKAGLIEKSFDGKKIDFKKSFVIGDRETDLFLGDTLGSRAILVSTGKGPAALDTLRKLGLEGNYPIFPDLISVARFLPHLKNY